MTKTICKNCKLVFEDYAALVGHFCHYKFKDFKK